MLNINSDAYVFHWKKKDICFYWKEKDIYFLLNQLDGIFFTIWGGKTKVVNDKCRPL